MSDAAQQHPGIRRIALPARVSAAEWAWLPPVLLAAALFALLMALVAFELAHVGRIYPGVRMWGLDVGGMTPQEAAGAIDAHFPYSNRPSITLRDGERTWVLNPADMGIVLDSAAIARSAYHLGRTGTPWGDLSQQAGLLWSGGEVGPVVSVDQDAARAYLQGIAASIDTAPRDADVRLDGLRVVSTPPVVGRTVDVDATLARLAGAARELSPSEVQLVIQVRQPNVADVTQAKQHLETLVGSPLTLVVDPAVKPGVGPWQVSPQDLASMLQVKRVDDHHVDVVLDGDRLAKYLAPIAPKIERSAIDARFTFNDELKQLQVISPSQSGLALDVAGTVARINRQAITPERQVTVAVSQTLPTYHEGLTAQELGITEVVTQAVTYFAGSARSRITNITTAARKFNGVIIAPGETFSFAKFLGDVSLDQGYAEALIIYNGRTIQGVGGGVCQVSTTLFRTAYFAGFPIVERWPHAYRVSWYERGFGPGLDATVYAPEVDFKFKNDLPSYLLIETYVYPANGTLLFKFYGTRDGRVVKIKSPAITKVTPHGPDKYEEDPTFKPGQKEQVDWAVDGADVTITRSVDKGGQVVTDTVFTRYEPWQAVYKVAPGEAPPSAEPSQ